MNRYDLYTADEVFLTGTAARSWGSQNSTSDDRERRCRPVTRTWQPASCLRNQDD